MPDLRRGARRAPRARLLEHAAASRLAGVVLFDEHYIKYFTGLVFLATERPVAVLLDGVGRADRVRAALRGRARRAEASFDHVESYPEYPGLEHPMSILARVAAAAGIRGAVGADQDGYPGILGYQGPSVTESFGASVTLLGAHIESMLARKSDAELALIRQSGAWCSFAHRLLQQYSVPGATEVEASLRAGHEATLALFDRSARSSASSRRRTACRPGTAARSGTAARGRTRLRTRSSSHRGLLVSETSAPIWGYNAELERAMVVGAPTDEQRRLFDHTVAAQEAAFAALRPGVTCADVDNAVLKYFEDNDLLPYWQQHTGHAIGLRNHEAPFLDVGDHTRVEPGMVFTIEPGLYVPGLGGFRHSDTVAVTVDGIEILTDYPRDLESLTISI